MAATEVTVIDAVRAGTQIANDDWVSGNVADGHIFDNDGKTILLVRNTVLDNVSVTLTVHATAEYDDLDVEDKTITIVIPEDVGGDQNEIYQAVGPFRKPTFNITSGLNAGKVFFETSSASLDFVAIKFP